MNQAVDAKSVFLRALDCQTPQELSSFLAEACDGDHELQARVSELLDAHRAAGKFLGGGRNGETNAFEPIAERPGTSIGPYRLLQQIGEGGMGVVFMAEQTEPLQRTVALKIIKPGMDTRQVIARFEAERQALALMDHPNIAKVLDAGTTDTGRPYFVMDLVKGVPVTDYCDQHHLSIPQRLELMSQVCNAVQHAHQKGIIHRDIKPNNVLVAEYDNRAVPKVIDFGVAKATAQRLTERTMFTEFGQIVGTFEYMSPEQAKLNQLDIDTRSDIYSLGVLLYELLTGSTPFEQKRFREAAFDEMLRIIREEEPQKPSTRLSSLSLGERAGSLPLPLGEGRGEGALTLASIAANRGVEPLKLNRLVQGELDWIVMKALEKDRNRRYETASGLASDIERYLHDDPVEACPPSASYRLRKFVRKHRRPVIAAAAVAMALALGVIGTTVGMLQAGRAAEQERQAKVREALRAEGEQKAKLQADEKRKEAERNLAFARKGNEILGSVFAGLNPEAIAESGRPLQDLLRENLTAAVTELEGSAIGDPLEVAAMQNTLGRSLVELGEAPLAVEVLQKALATFKDKLGHDAPDTLRCMNDLATGYLSAGMLDLAVPLSEETLKLTKAKFGPNHNNTFVCMNNLANSYRDSGQLDKALALLEETLPNMKAELGPDDPITLKCMSNLAGVYWESSQYAKAMPLFEETLPKMKAKFGPNHPDTLTGMSNLAMGYLGKGQLEKAVPLLKETLKLQKARLGPVHPDTLACMKNLTECYMDARKFDLALPLYEELLWVQKARLGPDHLDTLASMNDLGTCQWSLRRLDKSIPLFEELLPLREKKLGRDNPDTLVSVANLGVNYKDAGRVAEAIPLLEEAHTASKQHATLRWVATPLLDAYASAVKPAEAAKLINELLADARQTLPKDSPQLAGQLAEFGLVLLEMKGYAAAEPLLRECLAIREENEPNAWTTFSTQSMLGGSLLSQKKYKDAEPLLLKGYEGMKLREKAILPQGATRIPQALDRLIELYTATDKPEEAKKWRAERAKYPDLAPPP